MSAVSVRGLMFTDIEGSTALVARLGDRYESVLDRHQCLIRAAAARTAGVEQSREGDSLFITFPSANAALETAVDAQCRIEQEPWPPDGRVRVRIGLHMGEVAETRAGLVGLAIHRAARISSAGHGGQIVVSGDVVTQVGRLPADTSLRSLGAYDLRDVGRMELYQVQHPKLQESFPQLRTNRALAHNLPAQLTSMVGRVAETDAVTSLLREHRLVTLLGPGGCGKTRLALQVADTARTRFGDGVWFVDLAPVRAGPAVTTRVAQVLGVPDDLEDVVAALERRCALVVFDNCEHVLEQAATVVMELLGRCAMTTVVATSRAPLDVAGEVRYNVSPLALPRRGADLNEVAATESVQLFVARARLVRPHFRLSDGDVDAIVELCRRIDGLPLAIELAAAQLRVMNVAELLERLVEPFGVLVGSSRSAPERHRTLHNTIEWSFQLLDADEQRVLRHVAAFRGGCDAESAGAVCASELSESGSVLSVLVQLVDKSLVATVDADGSTRYGLHEMVREYALGSCSAAERAAIEERHARWFATLAYRLSAGPAPAGEAVWIRHHDVERDNFRAAVEWLCEHDPPAALQLLLDIEPGTDMTLQSAWCNQLVRDVLPIAQEAPSGARAAALSLIAWDDSEAGRPAADELLAEAVALLGDPRDPVPECYVLSAVVKCHVDARNGDLDESELDAALAAADRAGGTYWPIMIRYFLSWGAQPAVAESLTTHALGVAERLHLEDFGNMLRANLACIAQFRGDSAHALTTWRQAMSKMDDLLLHQGENACFYALAEAEHGELAVGLHIAEDIALRLTSRPHDVFHAAAMYSVLAHLRLAARDVEGAQAALDITARAVEPTLDFVGGLMLVTRSALCRHRGQPHTSAAVLQQAVHLLRYRGTTDLPMRVLEELAELAFALGYDDDSANLLTTAREIRQQEGKPLSPMCKANVDALQSRLGDRRGKLLSMRDVIGLAQSLANQTPHES